MTRTRVGAAIVAADVASEKFMDPLFLCFGSTKPMDNGLIPDGYMPEPAGAPYVITTPNAMNLPADLGYGYLSAVPADAASRIAKIREKIAAYPKPRDITPGFVPKTFFESLRQASYDNLRKVAAHVTSTFSDVKNLAALAESYGLPTNEIEKKAAKIREAGAQTSQYKAIDAAIREVAPIAGIIANSVANIVSGQYDPAFATVLGAVQLAANFIPVVGQAMAAMASSVSAFTLDSWKRNQEACADSVASISSIASDTLKAGFPIPLHAEEMPAFSPRCGHIPGGGEAGGYKTTREQENINILYRTNLAYFTAVATGLTFSATAKDKGLTLTEQNFVRRWWATTLAFMDDPRVAEVFHALGRDDHGGVLASDEQVMLVAAPIAVSHGLDVDDFARRLWERSKGWRGGNQDSFMRAPRVVYGSDLLAPPIAVGCKTGDESVRDAWWVQWAVLARDAYKLATEGVLEGTVMRTISLDGGDAGGSGGGVTPLVGGTALAAGAAAGVLGFIPIWGALALGGVGLLMLLTGGSSNTASSTPLRAAPLRDVEKPVDKPTIATSSTLKML